MGFKLVILPLAFVTFFTFVSGRKHLVEQAMERCLNETGTTLEELEDAEMRRPVATDKENVKCFVKCFLYKITLMDDYGNILEKPMDPDFGITEEDMKDVAHCLNVTGVTLCDKAFNFLKCTIEENNSIWSW